MNVGNRVLLQGHHVVDEAGIEFTCVIEVCHTVARAQSSTGNTAPPDICHRPHFTSCINRKSRCFGSAARLVNDTIYDGGSEKAIVMNGISFPEVNIVNDWQVRQAKPTPGQTCIEHLVERRTLMGKRHKFIKSFVNHITP